jgi:rhamnosyltransferase
MMDISVVIRTYNEERYLDELLRGIARQKTDRCEVVLVDSGSTDRTLEIAHRYECRIVHIPKKEFTFGRSLNLGCETANGSILVFVSGHCVPASEEWLERLVAPLKDGIASCSYGRQIGRDTTKLSEKQVFAKYYPAVSRCPQEGFFCNNANAAILKSMWEVIRFDENLTGLEDLLMGKELVDRGHKIAYITDAPVFHIHHETWHQVRMRYEREAVALREIMPEIHIGFLDFLRYFFSGVVSDCDIALRQRNLLKNISEIVFFRFMQFWGVYRGNREHRQISAGRREEYFFPTKPRREKGAAPLGGSSTIESK